jgi:hypothetical protein
MRHVEVRVGPLDRDPGIQKLLVGLVIGAVTAGARRVEHDAHVDARLLPIDDGRDQTRFGKRELFDQK